MNLERQVITEFKDNLRFIIIRMYRRPKMYNCIAPFDVVGLSQSSTASNLSFPVVQLILTSQP